MRTPVKVLSIMKLTTPPTASAPYTEDAPPVRTSTRLISCVGTKLMSGYGLRLSPAIKRRPLISTTVRFGPRLRRLTVAVPEAPFDRFEPCEANDCGSEL